MREYSKFSSLFWTGETGKKLRASGRDAQLVAAYLMTCRSANWLGLYYLPLPVLCHELSLSDKGALEALRRVSEADFAYFDAPSEHVWVPEMASHQIGDQLEPGDKRIKGIAKDLEAFRKTPYFNGFLEKYRSAFHLETVSPSEAPSKPLRSQEQEQEQEHKQEQEQKTAESCPEVPPAPSAPPDPVIFNFLVVGNGGREWPLLQSKLDEYKQSFPAVDIMAQCRIARQWCIDHPRDRKTPGGMPAFLSRWLTKEQNRGHAPGPGNAAAARRATLTPATEKVIRAFKIAKGNKEDPGWDALMLDKSINPANQLIAYFNGDWQSAVRCIEDVRDSMADFPSWGWDAVIKRAPDFKRAVAA